LPGRLEQFGILSHDQHTFEVLQGYKRQAVLDLAVLEPAELAHKRFHPLNGVLGRYRGKGDDLHTDFFKNIYINRFDKIDKNAGVIGIFDKD
jgi:hypothetical protein